MFVSAFKKVAFGSTFLKGGLNKIDINNLHKDKFITKIFTKTILKWI